MFKNCFIVMEVMINTKKKILTCHRLKPHCAMSTGSISSPALLQIFHMENTYTQKLVNFLKIFSNIQK